MHETKLQVKDIDVSLFVKYPKLNSDEAKEKVFLNGHGRFLPVLTQKQKIETLFIYKVAADVLNKAKIQFFLLDGNLLGLMRHQGFVPWDDDIDIGLSVRDWEQAKNILSCIVGFTLIPANSFHWKLYHTDHSFPFLDIFFYDHDDSYVWAMTYYSRITVIYPTHLVFPLTYANLDGVKVPIPRDSLAIVKRIFNYNVCQAYRSHVKNISENTQQHSDRNREWRVPCSELQYMFDMYHLDDNI
ncbi:uncharacterized protein RP688-like [Physella acuta]|uniref:uncharacterized protein RP688-like n=1 Tax=Physella acuta TaxID=109671 RepID=UPI0027DDABE9|nr:uncharacterized protein RP688-like [Physella acuta]